MALSSIPTHATDAEVAVRDRIAATDGPHVVHFWAPWCGNSRRELDAWPAFIERHPDVPIVFVTVWNDGESGADMLAEHGLSVRRNGDEGGTGSGIVEIVQRGDGSHEDSEGRRRHFLGLPLTWIPSTWIFHKRGQLAFAMNYGEADADTLGTLVDATQSMW